MKASLLRHAIVIAAGIVFVGLGGCDLLVSPEDHIARAEAHSARGEYRAAMIELKSALKARPEDTHSRLMLAEVSLRLGDVLAADKELRRALETGAAPASAAPLTAQVLLALGRGQELLGQVESGKLVLDEPARSLYIGEARLATGDAVGAERAFRTVLARDPRILDAFVGVADALALRGDYQGALAQLDGFLREHPEVAQGWITRGGVLLRLGKYADAEQAYVEALRHESRLGAMPRLMAHAGRTEAQLAQGDLDGAMASIAAMRKVATGAAPGIELLDARVALARQDYPAAVAILQRLVAAKPDLVAAQFLLGTALLAQGNLYQAESHLAAAVAAAPENVEARKQLAQLRLRARRPEAAIEALQPALDSDTADPQLEALLGAARMQMGDRAGAVALLEQRAARSPDVTAPKLDLAAARLMAGQAREALELLRAVPQSKGDIRRAVLLLRAAEASGGARAGRSEADRIVAEHPADAALLIVAGSYFTAQRDFDRARELLRRAVDSGSDTGPALLALGDTEAAAGNIVTARDALRQAAAMKTARTAAHMRLAELDWRQGHTAEARKWLEDLCELEPRAVQPRLTLARLYFLSRDSKRAEALLTEAQAIGGERTEVIDHVGNLQLDFGRYDQALASFRKAAELEPANPTHWLGLARAHLALDQQEQARQALGKAIEADPGSVPAATLSALIDLRAGRNEAALATAIALRRREPTNVAAALLEGDIRLRLGQHAQALAAFDEAARAAPRLAIVARQVEARRLAKLPSIDAPLREWIRTHPGDRAAIAMLAETYRVDGRRTEAIREYERLLAIDPKNPAVLNNLAWICHEAGDERAEQYARLAYQARPSDPAIGDTLGWILVSSGRLREALPILEAAAKAAQDQPDIGYHFAVALERAGDKARARSELDRVLGAKGPFRERTDAERLRALLRS